MKYFVFDGVVARVDAACAAAGTTVLYAQDVPDKNFPSIRWSVVGVLATNEIAVIAECYGVRFGCSAPSGLINPPMLDRIHEKIDPRDWLLASMLAESLWSRHADALISVARLGEAE